MFQILNWVMWIALLFLVQAHVTPDIISPLIPVLSFVAVFLWMGKVNKHHDAGYLQSGLNQLKNLPAMKFLENLPPREPRKPAPSRVWFLFKTWTHPVVQIRDSSDPGHWSPGVGTPRETTSKKFGGSVATRQYLIGRDSEYLHFFLLSLAH